MVCEIEGRLSSFVCTPINKSFLFGFCVCLNLIELMRIIITLNQELEKFVVVVFRFHIRIFEVVE